MAENCRTDSRKKKQYAYILFIPFVLISSYIILNIFIAIIVNGMRDARLQREEEQRKRQRAENRQYVAEQDELLLGILLAKLNEMEERILNPESGRATGSSNKTRDSATRATGTGRWRWGRRR
ncbi:MAG: hypothetical protein K2H64_09440 [Desulfovibrio sp.]|nr:hypothetical protein [Desulfovibrio sp.]